MEIDPEHLNTPRLVADSAGTSVWRWDQQEPFGVNVPDESPSGLGAFEMPLRFPGQYTDKETGLYYNYFRDYDASLGRYVESDPIGLNGGTNTYSYAYSNPVSLDDPEGLCACDLVTCVGKCVRNYGGDYALIALGFSSPFASIPFPGNKQLLGSTNQFTSLFSMATRSLGLSGVARAVRSLNPIGNVTTVGAGGYLIGLTANCGVRCSANCDQ